ncbi:MAG: DUF4835 family protein [Bacteroidales bacterium]|nr:DUF4835 family protein [Bacteroidales bacterium]
MLKRSVSILLALMLLGTLRAQEFRCAVSVNYQKLMTTTQSYESSDKKVFETMRQALEDFISSRRWTNLEMEQHERLDCSLSIILSERTSATDFKGQITIQLRRPVFNSNYTTGLFNYIESNDFAFVYNESQPLDFDANTFYSNLSSAVSYYLYIMLGIYFDSYGLNGGEPFYEMARTICQTADQMQTYKGWNSRESAKARYWFMENHTNSAYAQLHNAYYLYHRMGLDMMTKDQPQARQNIIAALQALQQVHKTRPNVLSVQQFIDVKITELVSIFTPAPADEQKQVYDIIKEISPISVAKLKDFATK